MNAVPEPASLARAEAASAPGARAVTAPRLATPLLALSMFFTGASGLIFEYLLSTVSTYILGNSIEQFSIVIALMLLMMGLAGWLQKFVSDALLVEKFLLIEAALACLGGIAPTALYASFGVTDDHFPLIQYGLVMAIGLLIGFEIPLVLRLNEAFSSRLRSNLASIISLDYVGSFVGALVWTWYLLARYPLTEISFLVAGCNFAVAAVTWAYFRLHGRVAWPAAPAVIILVTGGFLLYGLEHNRGWSELLEQRLYDDPVVFAETSSYQRLVLTHRRSTDEYRLYLNGNLQFSSADEAIYHELLVHPAMAAAPVRERVLILGGGDGMALREVLKYPDVQAVMLVDIDPAMTRLARTHPVLRRLNDGALEDGRVVARSSAAVGAGDPRPIYQETGRFGANGRPETERVATVRVLNLDADRFLSELAGSWDVVIVDFPDPGQVELSKLYSLELYRKLGRVLSEHGVFVTQATSPYHAKEAFLCIARTIEAAGFEVSPYHENVPSFGDWGWLLARRRGVGASLEARLDGIEALTVPTRYATPEAIARARVFGKGMLESTRTEVNTLMQPVLLSLYLEAGWQIE